MSIEFDDYVEFLEYPFLEFVFWYNNQKLKCAQYIKTITAEYIAIRYIVEFVSVFLDMVFLFLRSVYTHSTQLYIEPHGNWISLIAIHNNEPDVYYPQNYHFVEKYVYPVENECTSVDSRMSVFFAHAKNTFEADKNVYEILITLKETADYFVRTCNHSDSVYYPISLPREKSHVEFLCVEYVHPEMKSPISLNIPASYFLVGNELLSMAFVRRILEYKSVFTSFVFDEKYVVNVIDATVIQHRITCRNYIVLEKDTLRVVEIPEVRPSPMAEKFWTSTCGDGSIVGK